VPLRPMDPLESLLAEREIRDVIYRYCRGVDRVDLDLVRSCYHPDGIDDHGSFRGDVDEYVGWLAERLGRYQHTSHTIGNVLIRFKGSEAWVESYCGVHQRYSGEAGASPPARSSHAATAPTPHTAIPDTPPTRSSSSSEGHWRSAALLPSGPTSRRHSDPSSRTKPAVRARP
jgi:hypothetical protein